MENKFSKIPAILLRCLVSIIPRNKHLIVYGGAMDYFIDNVKYLFILHQQMMPDYQHVWLTRRDTTYNQLLALKLPVYKTNSPKGWYYHLRAGFFISDDEIDRFAYHNCSSGAIRINLWHGVPFKMIGWIHSDNDPAYQPKSKLWEKYVAHHLHGDYCLSTSKSISRHFSSALHFPLENIYISGYPRTFLFYKNEEERLEFVRQYETKDMLDTYLKIKGMHSRKIIYMPTFRDKNPNYIDEAIPNWKELDEVLKKNNNILYLKVHRMTPTPQGESLSNIVILDNSLDIYPLLPLFDCLISDYSSIMSDFGLLKRPVVLYAYDLDDYISHSRPVFKRFWDVYEKLSILKTFDDLKSLISNMELPASYFPVETYYDCPQDIEATKRLIERLT